MKKFNKTAFVIGSSIIASSAAINTANAESNPFAVSDLSSGYMNIAEAGQEAMGKMKEASCGEGKCGANKANKMMKKAAEGKCGENKAKAAMDKTIEGTCGTKKSAATAKVSEGKCG